MDRFLAAYEFFNCAPQKLILWMRDTHGNSGAKGSVFRFECYINIVLYRHRFQAWPSIPVCKTITERIQERN